MPTSPESQTVGVLFSGGLDSGILLGRSAVECRGSVVPLFINSGLVWQHAELKAARRFIRALDSPRVRAPIVLELPLADLYESHWSVTGVDSPDAASPDEAVYLPSRNALLIVKAATWCQLHGIGKLALGVLSTSPFDDARAIFFKNLEAALNCPPAPAIRLTRPFAQMDKSDVMRLGRGMPLEETFSCLAPVGSLHCGACNKCAERKRAFRAVGIEDPTDYGQAAAARSPTARAAEGPTCSE